MDVVVVDNGSADGSVELVEKAYPEVRLIRVGRNRGFAAGSNQGIFSSLSRYILLLNNDAWLEPGTLATLVAFADAHPTVGMAGPRVITDAGFLQPTYGPTFSLARILFPDRRYESAKATLAGSLSAAERQQAQTAFVVSYGYDRTHQVEHLSGVCLLVRRQMIDQIGALDEGFFLYYEDQDWCVRAKRAGWELCYVAEATAHHELRRIGERRRPPHLAGDIRHSQVRFLRKHSGLLPAAIFGALALGQFGRQWLRLWWLALQGRSPADAAEQLALFRRHSTNIISEIFGPSWPGSDYP
jgi:GT2 family glycosyltransferase